MSKDFDNIIREINKTNKELYEVDAQLKKDFRTIEKDVVSIKKDIASIKIQTQEISNKIDILLEIMQNLSIMVLDDEEDTDDYGDFDSDQTWVPDEDDDWSNNEDES